MHVATVHNMWKLLLANVTLAFREHGSRDQMKLVMFHVITQDLYGDVSSISQLH